MAWSIVDCGFISRLLNTNWYQLHN